LITDQCKIYAILEERITRKKYDGGYEKAFNQLQIEHSNEIGNIELSISSTCCEPEREFKFEQSAVNETINHHLSHAKLAYRTSLFNSALVVIIDGGGNVLEPMSNDNWWEHKREQHSYYSLSNNILEFIGHDFSEPMAYGLGEFWRGITYFTGFNSSTYAAKVMELSSMGDPIVCETPYYIENGKLHTNIEYTQNKLYPIASYLQDQGINEYLEGPCSKLGDKIKLSAWAQIILEQAIIEKLKYLKSITGHSNLCLGGGVFLNCKLVGRILQTKMFKNVHVSFAPSDKGQCIGNALYAAEKQGLINKDLRITSPFIGSNKIITTENIRRYLDGRNTYLFKENINLESLAEVINVGTIVGIFENQSEFGARALGNRSIVASPFLKVNKEKLNKLKGRELYTPVAPSISTAFINKYFLDATPSPYMERVYFKNNLDKLNVEFSAALHQDGSARVQTIDGKIENSFLNKFIHYCDGGMLLNTSFNGKGHPIVELPEDAIAKFFDLELDAMYMNGHFIWKKSAMIDSVIAETSHENWLFFFRPDRSIDDETFKNEIMKCINLTNVMDIDLRERFSLYDNYINWLEEGRKVTTIRFIPNGLSIPIKQVLPLIRTRNFKQDSMDFESNNIKVLGFGIKKFYDLNLIDAKRDGFNKTSQLKTMLRRIYPKMTEDSYVSINFIEQV